VLLIGRQRVVVPPMVFVQLPGDSQTLQQLFANAPARCREQGSSGLLRSDPCILPADELPATIATVKGGTGETGEFVAASVALTRVDDSVWGAVTFVNERDGSLRIGGAFGADLGGTLVRLNDPDARQSVQSGNGCGAEGNCSPDRRFKVDAVYFTVRFTSGHPACVPGPLGDACTANTRPVSERLDPAVMVPIVAGDHVTARGGFQVVDGTRVFWAHTLLVHSPER
jgi:hypothetical protein